MTPLTVWSAGVVVSGAVHMKARVSKKYPCGISWKEQVGRGSGCWTESSVAVVCDSLSDI